MKRKGTAARPSWYVDDRLVVRLDEPGTAVVPVPLDRREELLDAYLDRADPAGVRRAIELAWEMQRH